MRFILIIILSGLLNTLYAEGTKIISGKITDAETSRPVSGATIYVPELKINTISNPQGEFHLKDVPLNGKYIIEISFLGYQTLIQTIDFSQATDLHFSLKTGSHQMQEVAITGTAISSTNKKNSTSATALSKADLMVPSTNIIDAIARQAPGVSAITTGPSISKPVIRGLSSNRVVTIGNGIKQQGNQWGDEHGIEIDQYDVDRVEVLRGAASLMYGSDALGGVINMLEPLSPSEGSIKGEMLTNYSTNSGLTASSLMLSGNHSGFVWRGRGTYKNVHSFKTPTGYFPNSGFNEGSLSSMLGVNKSWGYSHLNFSYFKNNIGFYEPEFDDNGNYVDEDENSFSESDFKNRKLSFPRQDIRHYKLAWNNNIITSSGAFKINLGYQRNQRREMDEPSPALFLDLNTFNAELKYSLNEKQGWQPVFGLSAEAANSSNKGTEFLLPDYTTSGLGGFAYIKKTWEKTTFNGGVRYDYRRNNGDAYTKEGEPFEGYTNSFSNVSGAVGMTYELNSYFNLKANVGSAFRSPNPAELSSNGVHEGTFRYEIGNPSLKPERSYQSDITLEYNRVLIDGSISLYTNFVNDFIYISSQKGDEIDGMAIYRYGQVDAVLKGFEGNLNIHPINNLHLHNTFAYTHAQNKSLNRPLPFIPAGVVKNTLRYEPSLKGIKQSYLSVGLDNFFKQARIDDTFETVTSGYSLLNAAVGTTVSIGRQPISVYISGSNLLNKKYYDALSRLKPGRLDHNNPDIGIYNVGRNITFGVALPI